MLYTSKKDKKVRPSVPKSLDNTRHEYEYLQFTQDSISALLTSEFGYIVGRLGDELMRFQTDTHLITTAPTGGGKGTGAIIPNLLDHPGSAFVIDIRGETLAATADIRRLMGQRVVVLDPYNITGGRWGRDSYNPLNRVKDHQGGTQMIAQIKTLVRSIMYDPHGRISDQPIWDGSTSNLLKGLFVFALKYWPEHKHTLDDVYAALLSNESEMSRLLEEVTIFARDDRQLRPLIQLLTTSREKTKITDNAFVQAQTCMEWLDEERFVDITSRSTFSFSDMQKRPMTVYLVIPDEHIKNCAVWTRIMIDSAIYAQENLAMSGKRSSDIKQDERILFLIDEFPAFGKMDIVTDAMPTVRGRGINLWLFVQHISQLDMIYGEKDAQVIIGNTSLFQAFDNDEVNELEYFAKIFGEEFFDLQSVAIQQSRTEGESDAEAVTKTISNSQSFSTTSGTSDTTQESVGINWSKATGTNWQKSKNKSRTSGSQTGWSKGSSKSKNRGTNSGSGESEGETYHRNFFFNVNDNYNKGKSKNNGKSSGRTIGTNQGLSGGRNKSTTKGTTRSKGGSEVFTEGGQESSSKSHTTSHSTTTGEQSGTSEGTSETHTTSFSLTEGRTVTHSLQRLKLETVRSLRSKLSEHNQLLKIKGVQPFFCPKMFFPIKYRDQDRFMFPDKVVLTGANAVDELISRLNGAYDIIRAFGVELDENEKVIDDYIYIGDHYSRVDLDVHTREEELNQVLADYKTLYGVVDVHEKVLQTMKSQFLSIREKFDELAIAYLSILAFLEKNSEGEMRRMWIERKYQLLMIMANKEKFELERLISKETDKKVRSLRLLNSDESSVPAKLMLVKAYSEATKRLCTELKQGYRGMRDELNYQSEAQSFFIDGLLKARDKDIPKVIEAIMMREIEESMSI